MELLLIVVVVAAVLLAVRPVLRWRDRRRELHAEMQAVRRLAADDVGQLGQLLDEVDRHLAGFALDAPGRAEHQQARDAFEAAKVAAAELRSAHQAKELAENVCAGRYALERLRARWTDQPAPTRQTPCFFDPRHGPADHDVLWTRPGHGSHTVPACAADATRVAHREKPQIRTVGVRGRTVPYWDAGVPFLGYCDGCFGSAVSFLAAPAEGHSSVDPSARAYDMPGLLFPPHGPGSSGGAAGSMGGFGGGGGAGGCGGGGGGSC